MLYLATYPRSGNSLLQGILRKNFGYRRLDEAKEITIEGRSKSVLDPRIPEIHGALAAQGKVGVYLKTHALPFDPFIAGDRIVQFVRHPGASLLSYFRLLADNLPSPESHRFKVPPPTLDAVLSGEVGVGSWSGYHEAWSAAASGFPDGYLMLKYEDVIADQAAARATLGRLLSASPQSEQQVSFERYQARKGISSDVRGTSSGYERFYSRRQLELLWLMHGKTAEKFGYAPPDFAAASPDEQVMRLNRMLEVAWAHAAKLESLPLRRIHRRVRRALQRKDTGLRR
jgi:hypothetical protein